MTNEERERGKWEGMMEQKLDEAFRRLKKIELAIGAAFGFLGAAIAQMIFELL